jgi:hypothetical protein
MNLVLDKEFTAMEVGEALMQMGLTKAPGPKMVCRCFFINLFGLKLVPLLHKQSWSV